MNHEVLLRHPTEFAHQDRFGKSDNPAGQRGNCFQTCLAAILRLPVEDVPHFYDTDEDEIAQNAATKRWLAERGWVCFWVPWNWVYSDWVLLPPNGLVIVSGKSPRGDWGHVVVGKLTGTDWTLVHDPHPDATGLDGIPNGFYLLAPLPYT